MLSANQGSTVASFPGAEVTALCVCGALVVTLLPVTLPLGSPPEPLSVSLGVSITPANFPIHHIVFVIMENHAYDNYFGTYCLSVGQYCPFSTVGLNLSYCIPLYPAHPTKGCRRPYALNTTDEKYDMAHDYNSSHRAYNNGLMNNFYLAEGKDPRTFGYYGPSILPTYWVYAEQYGLADNFFSSTLSYSLPNHWFIIAAQAPAIAEQGILRKGPNDTLTANDRTYLNEANDTRTVQDILLGTAVTWKMYDDGMAPTYEKAIQGNAGVTSGITAFNYWNPMLARAETYDGQFQQNFVLQREFFQDAEAGTLPNLSWVIPSYNESDHPPNSLAAGQQFVNHVITAIEKSPEWNSTAVFVTWDDYGGYYDSVAPLQIDQWGLSFRVPLLVVSPYTPEGYVSDHFAYFESFLRMAEWQYGLPNITVRDGRAPLLTNFFDTQAQPRPPLIEPYKLSYPQTFQSLPAPNPPVSFSDQWISPTQVQLNWSEGSGKGPVAGWLVQWGLSGGSLTHSVRLDRLDSGIVIGNLTSGDQYTFTVASFDGPQMSLPVEVILTAPLPSSEFRVGLALADNRSVGGNFPVVTLSSYSFWELA
jgi:phospholipase C